MKSQTLLLLLILITVFYSCNHNHMKADERSLSKQILTEEEQLAREAELRAEREKQLADSIAKLPKGFRFKEDRSVDSQNPPVIIDVPGTNENIRDFKLSDVASSIKYIKLEAPRDTLLLWTLTNFRDKTSSVISDDNHILIQNVYGVTQFSMDGKFQEVVWKNESGIHPYKEYVYWNPQELFGVTPDNPVSLFNGNLYLRFQDGAKKQVQMISRKVQNDLVLDRANGQQENQLDTLTGDRLLTIKEKYVSRKYPLIYGLGQNCWAGIHDTWNAAENGSSFVVFNNNGDTLCTVSNPNQIKNWTKTTVRAGEPFTYYYKNHLTFIGQHADTLFRFIPPNRMLPVYVLDFGKDKVSFLEGLDPGSDLSQKLMLYSIFETDNFIFIRYTKNNPGPQNLKNKSVAFYNAIFDKTENKLYHFPGQSLTPVYITNDIDGGISFWPEFITPKGNMLMLVTGKELKEYIKSNEFENNDLTAEQRQGQIDKAQVLKNNDIVVMIVK